MNVEFVRFEASDGVELQGWLSAQDGDLAVLHMHGKAGNGYENHFLDNLRQMYIDAGVTFFSIDNRGRGVISDFRQGPGSKPGGSCYEIFAESAYDIQGALDFLRSRGKSKFILQGHSLGCTKSINYLLTHDSSPVVAAVFLAPTDMTGWAGVGPDSTTLMERAKTVVAQGKGGELLSAECGLDKTPMSAAAYVSMHDAGSAVDVYGERNGGPLLGRLKLPVLICYGDQDIGIIKIDGSIDAWLTRVNVFKNSNTEVVVVEGAAHSFVGHEKDVADKVRGFLDRVSR